ncbi:hypothetical protein Hanom_Chr14g01265021 [Helianthus anomalus]
MAMERYVQETLEQNNFNKEDDASLNKRKSSRESIDESESCSSGGFDCNICLDDIAIPHKSVSPRCNVLAQQVNHHHYQFGGDEQVVGWVMVVSLGCGDFNLGEM